MKKPTKKSREYFDYHECSDYLQKKYKYNERDYLNSLNSKKLPINEWAKKHNYDVSVLKGKLKANSPEMLLRMKIYVEFEKAPDKNEFEIEYQDFWHWVIENHEVSNGCFIGFEKSELEYIEEDWVKKIYGYYIDEFADENGELSMWVSW